MSVLKIGQKAPDFKLIGTDLEPIKLGDYKGKNLILHFFPLAFTSVCTAQMCMSRDAESDYSKLNAEVLGVSVDSPFVLDKFGKENNLNFKLGSDFNRTVSNNYGVLFEDDFAGMTHFSKRSAFVIDNKGVVQYAEVTDGKSLPNFEKISETLSAI
ncbi:redoxin domain-containing protein [Spongiivirga sp. MCCC 1A20706]|uniref:redoxin domain-containing protein n=1 Tax=Spongiivirga sp. MCCC 1A20706 TaxID=3160963 RepID=UPI003977C996